MQLVLLEDYKGYTKDSILTFRKKVGEKLLKEKKARKPNLEESRLEKKVIENAKKPK